MQGFLTTITPFLFVNGALLGYYSQYSILFGEHIEQKKNFRLIRVRSSFVFLFQLLKHCHVCFIRRQRCDGDIPVGHRIGVDG